MDAIRQEFRASLADLTTGLRPVINSLTDIAKESKRFAPAIVQAIQDHLRVAHPKYHLFAMYLVDSILKNVGGVYISEFSKIIIPLFKATYQVLHPDDKTRMRKMLDTWKTFPQGPVFAPLILTDLQDFVLRQHDPQMSMRPNAGVSIPPVSSAIHPGAFTRHQIQPPQGHPTSTPSTASPTITSLNPTNNLIIQQIKSLLSQKQSYALMNPLDTLNNSHIQILNQLLNLVQTTLIDVDTSVQITQQLHQISATIPTPNINRSALPLPSQVLSIPVASILNNQSNFLASSENIVSSANPSSTNAPMSPTSLVSNLMKYGLLGPKLNISSNNQNGNKMISTIKDMSQLPSLSLKSDLTRKRPEAIFFLYDALELQCKQCGIRMQKTEENKAKMDAHLDWHFRQNRRAKERGRHPVARNWFVSLGDWIEEKEVVVTEQLVPFQEEMDTIEDIKKDLLIIPDLHYTEADSDIPCVICNEFFEKYWNDDDDDWMLRNAIKVDGKLLHFTCYHDAKRDKTSRAPSTEAISESPRISLKRKVSDDNNDDSNYGGADSTLKSEDVNHSLTREGSVDISNGISHEIKPLKPANKIVVIERDGIKVEKK